MEQDAEKIKDEFLALKTRQDVAELLGIKEKSLRYFLYAIRPDNMYSQFVIKKKTEMTGVLMHPIRNLKIYKEN